MRRLIFSALAAFVLTTSLGCLPVYDRLDITIVSGQAERTPEGLAIAKGQAVRIFVEPISRNRFEDYEEFDIVDLQSLNSSIAVVAPTIHLGEFVVGGVEEGVTRARVRINGNAESELPIMVVDAGVFE